MRETPNAAHTLQEQLMAHVEHLLQERRKRNVPVETERRAVNPKLASDAEWRDVDFALDND